MKPKIIIALVILALTNSCNRLSTSEQMLSLQTQSATFTIGSKGQFLKIEANGVNLLSSVQNSPVLQVRVEGKDYLPDSAVWDVDQDWLTLQYNDVKVRLDVEIKVKPTHITMELVGAESLDRIDCVLWGPYATNVNLIVGEVVGVVRDREFAVGIQALNAKTQGGPPVGMISRSIVQCYQTQCYMVLSKR